MDRNGFPVERSFFTVIEKKEFDLYVLFSEKYKRGTEINIYLFDNLKQPDVGDCFELPDCMLYEDEGLPFFSNRLLQFGLPSDRHAIPEDFNIENDYAYLLYQSTEERVKLQRCYG